MTKDESNSELEKLRAEVAQLREAQQIQSATQESPAQTTEESVEEQTEQTTCVEDVSDEINVDKTSSKQNEQAQLDELMALVGKEVKDLPTVTTLAVFSLGLLMGRYLR